VLIYGDFPTAGWNIEGFLKISPSDFSLPTPLTLISLALQNLGIKTCSLRSSMDASKRAAVINRFNDPNSNVRALVTRLKNSSFGLNLQYCCSDLIIMAVAENVNLILQIIGRIHRLRQVRIQCVWVITLARSYNNYLQHKQTNKMIAQLAGEADVTVKDNIIEDSESNLDKKVNRMKGRQIRD
jgi:SNF2 family DNA or RNA helicase